MQLLVAREASHRRRQENNKLRFRKRPPDFGLAAGGPSSSQSVTAKCVSRDNPTTHEKRPPGALGAGELAAQRAAASQDPLPIASGILGPSRLMDGCAAPQPKDPTPSAGFPLARGGRPNDRCIEICNYDPMREP
jgi:hypothetical protein